MYFNGFINDVSFLGKSLGFEKVGYKYEIMLCP